MILFSQFKIRLENEEDIEEILGSLDEKYARISDVENKTIRFKKEIASREELDEIYTYITELPVILAQKSDIPFEYEGFLDTLDEFVNIQAEFNGGKLRYQDIEEEACFVGEKVNGKVKLRGADEDEHARFFD